MSATHLPDKHNRQGAGTRPRETEDDRQVVQFEDLPQRGQEVLIEFRGQRYRLRTTRNGGLILNK